MSRLTQLGNALRAWETFIREYAVVEPSAAFDLYGDPPQWIRDLNAQTLGYCAEHGIEVDNPPSASQSI